MAFSEWLSGVKGSPPADPRPPLGSPYNAPAGGCSLIAPIWPEAESAAPYAQNYPAQIQAAYERNAIEQRAVRIVANGGAAELLALHPGRVQVQAAADGWPIAYAYRDGDGAEVYPVAAPDQLPELIHIKVFQPSDDLIDMSCLGAAGRRLRNIMRLRVGTAPCSTMARARREPRSMTPAMAATSPRNNSTG